MGNGPEFLRMPPFCDIMSYQNEHNNIHYLSSFSLCKILEIKSKFRGDSDICKLLWVKGPNGYMSYYTATDRKGLARRLVR